MWERGEWNPVGPDMQLLANPFSAESRLTDAPSSCSFAIYTFIHIFNHLYCRERREWVNETDVGSWKARWVLVLAVNHIVILTLYPHMNLCFTGVSWWGQQSTWGVRGHAWAEFDWHVFWAVSVCVTVLLHLQKIDSLSLRSDSPRMNHYLTGTLCPFTELHSYSTLTGINWTQFVLGQMTLSFALAELRLVPFQIKSDSFMTL